MDTLKKRQEIIKSILQQFNTPYSVKPKTEEFNQQLIIDDANGHYLLMVSGWDNLTRIYNSIIHLDLKDDKIFIQSDATEAGLANLLIKKGVPIEDIVLNYVAPYRRPYMELVEGCM